MCVCERERERERETDRQTDRVRETDRQRETETETERKGDRMRQRGYVQHVNAGGSSVANVHSEIHSLLLTVLVVSKRE